MKDIVNQFWKKIVPAALLTILGLPLVPLLAQVAETEIISNPRQRISINDGWRFYKYDSTARADNLIYDVRPEVKAHQDDKPADTRPTEAEKVEISQKILKPWIMPTGNEFIKDPAKHYIRPESQQSREGSDFPFVRSDFDDSSWENVNLPHDWAIKGPFFEGPNPEVGGGMGRLPSPGVAWYRKKLDIPASDIGKSISSR